MSYLLDRPAIISVSGGRSSGFMLRKIIDAFGGTLPDDVIPVFCNTGLEHERTYEFLAEMERRWAVRIRWLQYRDDGERHAYEEVTHGTHATKGEPFEALIRRSQYVPNPVTRKCTVELKIRTTQRFVRSLGWSEHTNAIGLRADEPRRVAKLRGDVKAEMAVAPMAVAGDTIDSVRAFWSAQPFDLMLPGGDNAFGNCVGCFLKSKDRLLRVFREEPDAADWWIRMETLGLAETAAGSRFRTDRPSYAALKRMAQEPMLFNDGEDTLPCNCTD